MKNIIKLLVLTLFLINLMTVVSALTLDVKHTQTGQISFEITNEDLGWQNSTVNIFNEKNNLIYTYTDYIYFQADSTSFQILDCPECKPGLYRVELNINGNTTQSVFSIQEKPLDLFWIIVPFALILLIIVAMVSLKHKPKPKVKSKITTKSISIKKENKQ